jgi:4-hydroxythreonine-4-phosphate dehydrogenase
VKRAPGKSAPVKRAPGKGASVTGAPGKRIAVSIGCPCGVGPEVSVVAAAKAATRESAARVLLVGDFGAVVAAARGRGIAAKRIVRVPSPDQAWGLAPGSIGVWQPGADLAARDRKPGAPTGVSGAAQLAWVDAACDLAATGAADALVTGPVSKEAIARSGAPGAAAFLGHTEHLQRRLRAREVVMAFWSPELATSLATTHIPLARVPREVTPARVARAAYWLAWLLARTGSETPRIAVASLNPHAGEGGLLGREERTRIVPGIASARLRLRASRIRATLEGPIPAETAFRLATAREARGAQARRWSGVVALYHDQATIPMKVAVFGEAVNVSLGLPIVRTSVDHGTAYDRAGTWTADARGMTAAIALAARLAQD